MRAVLHEQVRSVPGIRSHVAAWLAVENGAYTARQLAGLIDSWKNRALSPDKVPKGESFSFGDGKGGYLWRCKLYRPKLLYVSQRQSG